MSINNKVVEACKFQPRSQREKNLTFTNVYVKYIPRHCSEQMCKEAFGKLVSDKLAIPAEITNSIFWDKPYGVSGCFNFKTHDQARTAVEILNQFDLRTIYPEQNENDNNTTTVGHGDDGNNDDNDGKADEKDDSGDKDESGYHELSSKWAQKGLWQTTTVGFFCTQKISCN